MTTDATIRHELRLATLSESTRKKLREKLPETASINNPVDVIGDATHERYGSALRGVLEDEEVDGVIVILTPQAMTDILETAEIVPSVAEGIEKPVLCSFMGLVDVSEGVNYLESHGIPNYPFPEAAARTMAAMARFHRHVDPKHPRIRDIRQFPADREKVCKIFEEKLKDRDQYYMPEKEASEVLEAYGFPLLQSQIVTDVSELEAVIEKIGLPVAMKIDSPDIVHKSDLGGVRLKLKTMDEAKQAYEEILENILKAFPDAHINGVLVEEMARGGVEVILGATRDPQFGPLCMFGLGGILVEAVKDVTFRLAPMWESSADHMVQDIKGYHILQGVRGNPPSDIDAIKICILRLSQMVSDHPAIKELDINPLIVYPQGQGCVVADSRILLAKKTS